jgi:hypothetical protein
MFSRSLTELANEYGTDKGTLGPSRGYGGHGYTDVYEGYLSRLRNEPLSVLEIGVGARGSRWKARIVHGRNRAGGASLKMWEAYFPFAQVFGIDINPAEGLSIGRIKTFAVDQGSQRDLEVFLKRVQVNFDLIVDDGSHRPDHQQISLGILFPRLNAGGLYFIEDLQNNGLGDREGGSRSCNRNVLNTRHVLGRYRTTREFPVPNALTNAAFLKESIENIVFHLPIYRIVPTGAISKVIRGHGLLVQPRPGTERLCVITKR